VKGGNTLKKERADLLLLRSGRAESRQKAQALILSGQAFWGEHRVEKAGELLPSDAEITVKTDPCPFVSRGGLKLDGALSEFGIEVKGLSCIDIGSSTGGFTDCLLKRGALRVIAIDVGHNQLHFKLRQDSRVHSIEGYNVRYLKKADLPFTPELAVIDVSFISLKIILAAVRNALPFVRVVALVKPQFEAGRGKVGKGGVVRDESTKTEVLDAIKAEASRLGFSLMHEIKSSIKGPKGNEEFFLHLVSAEEMG
jgi:23S rRNA (cytidine1920-2'-O)/16S rRNA (cytidine1409-2'-O)-methyltransferase